ncbi:hypothetical protein SAMN05216251_12720 [Actinacidiphila alni]|uniref:Gene product 88 domain-containing protein n=1 Tax=Actinacidiphila alni TaxID=380248 RepID=A0A1I2LBY4_9ACTN|nr:hypothetical protein [Actinacidiphila alni]SFF74701.1 hypothetical protein SAMN05216251_12720 [Actinacidiphila alni]
MPKKWLLRQNNKDLSRDRIWVWSLPAWVVSIPGRGNINVCPSAGVCARLCYARTGTYRFSNVRAAHLRNLELTFDLPLFEQCMRAELQHPRYHNGHVRLHDAGDFYSREYALAWLRIARSAPQVHLYAYTKEVALFKDLPPGSLPPNLDIVFSFGGRDDHRIEPGDRAADVFHNRQAIDAAGYFDQAASDLLAVTGPPRVGMAANNIPHLLKQQGPHSFRQLQAEQDRQHAARLVRARQRARRSADSA